MLREHHLLDSNRPISACREASAERLSIGLEL